MPIYLFKHPIHDIVVEVVQSIHAKHEYIDETGLKWERIFTVPQASCDTKFDAMSSIDFVNKTGKKKGTMGDLWDKSAELKEKRAKMMGRDFVADASLKQWSKERRGKKHPVVRKELAKNKLSKLGVEIE